jgi:uncharacterized membrane protein YeaQ/YmgE (transglycosylase-associated protein family)
MHAEAHDVQATHRARQRIVMEIIWTIIIGAVVGLVAKFIMPGKDPGGFIITPLIGIGGAIVAKFLGQAIGIYDPGQPAGFIGSVIGAIIILIIYRVIRQKSAPSA